MPIEAKPPKEKPPMSINAASASIDADVLAAANWKWDSIKNIKRHRYGYIDCPSCHEYVNAHTHRCFIQKALSPQVIKEQKKERKRKRQRQKGPPAKRVTAVGLQTLWANEGNDDDSNDDDEPPPCMCF